MNDFAANVAGLLGRIGAICFAASMLVGTFYLFYVTIRAYLRFAWNILISVLPYLILLVALQLYWRHC
ncbi:MAG TPA: hypothetical protein PLW55_11720 [Leptospiraceae bacterium]|nr:hypothetical protein [Leptospiraceae bacterium]